MPALALGEVFAEQLDRLGDLALGRLRRLGEVGDADRVRREEEQRFDRAREVAHAATAPAPAQHPDRPEVLLLLPGHLALRCRARAGRRSSPPGSAGPPRRTPRRSRSWRAGRARRAAPAAGAAARRSGGCGRRRLPRARAAGRRSPSRAAVGVVDRDRRVDRDPPQVRRAAAPSGRGSRARPRSARPGRPRRRGSGGTRASARAAPRPPPRVSSPRGPSSSRGSISRDFSSSSEAIRTRNSVATSRSSSPCSSRWST